MERSAGGGGGHLNYIEIEIGPAQIPSQTSSRIVIFKNSACISTVSKSAES